MRSRSLQKQPVQHHTENAFWSLFIMQDTLGSLQAWRVGERSKRGCCSAAHVPGKALELRVPSRITSTQSFPSTTSLPTQRSGQPHEPNLTTDRTNLCSYLRESNLRMSSSRLMADL